MHMFTTGSTAPYTIATGTPPYPYLVASNVLNGWNMTGIPVVVPNFLKTAVYPTATSYAFAYIGGYVVKDTLSNNRGWWIKFGSAQNIVYEGDLIDHMEMVVNNGWNIIGSISSPVAVATNVSSDPPNIIVPPFYRYDNGYVATTILQPGGGYWVKTSASGYVILDANNQVNGQQSLALGTYDKFTIADATGGEQVLYVRNGELVGSPEDIAMPPPPPDSLFDVRFSSGDFVKTVFPDSGAATLSIALNEVVYPVQLTWEIRPENGITYSIVPDSGSGLGKGSASMSIRDSSSMVMSSPGSGFIRFRVSSPKTDQILLPTQYTLHQNYPNPFNPSTQIKYDLPDAGNVSLVVYDVLGRRVAELASGYREAGYHSTSWNAVDQASGVYFARFSVTNAEGKPAYSKVNKLVLMK